MSQSIFEKYRPVKIEDVIGQDKAIKTLARFRDRGGFGGRAYWIAADSGQGKTSLARAMALEFADEFAIVEIDAQDCTLDFLREMERSFSTRALGEKTGKVWIVNEAHGLRGPVLSRFLTTLEALPSHVVIIFTTTKTGQDSLFAEMDDAAPMISRCIPVPMQGKGLCDLFAARLLEIGRLEGLLTDDDTAQARAVRLVKEKRNNMRACLVSLEAGALLS